MSERTVVLLDRLASDDGPVALVVRRTGATPVGVEKWADAKELLHAGTTIAAVFPASMRGFEELCLEVRSELGGEDLPLIAIVGNAWDAQLGRLFMFSIDDYAVEDELDGLQPKLLALGRGSPWANVSPEAGRVVVADPDPGRRLLYGRLLRRKGLGVDFALDQDDLMRRASQNEDVKLVLSATDLPPRGMKAAFEAFRVEGGRLAALPWVVEGNAEQLDAVRFGASATAQVRLFDNNDPPESVLFHVNDLLNPSLGDARTSPRLLYGGPACFRVVGSRHQTSAFTYNVNRTGLFIRTLVPPPRDSELIIDVRPPFGEGRARVYGKVVWRKECRQEGGPVVPTGMGVTYTRVPLADGAALTAGYEKLLESAPGEKSGQE
jgi:CheY-like chemotaxis protein